jgi:hypothetical protein
MSAIKLLPQRIYQWIIALRLRYLLSRIHDRIQTLSEMGTPVKG